MDELKETKKGKKKNNGVLEDPRSLALKDCSIPDTYELPISVVE